MKLALGTVQFGLDYGIANKDGQVRLDEVRKILDYGFALGMNTLDTAIGYGASEQILGEAGVEQWKIVSKLPAMPDGCVDIAQWAESEVDGSLRRLKVDRLYGLLLHRPQQLLEQKGRELYHAMRQLQHDGRVNKIGVSIYEPSELDALCHRYQFDLVQSPFSLIDHRLINSGWLKRLASEGSEIHVRSVFLQGLLLMQASDRPMKFNRWAKLWSRYDDWLSNSCLSPAQACLRYVLSFPEISQVVLGVDNLTQLKDVFQVATGEVLCVPDDLCCEDIELINPARWADL